MAPKFPTIEQHNERLRNQRDQARADFANIATHPSNPLRAENERWKATMKAAVELGGRQEEELTALRAENERLTDELRLVISPQESVGAVVTALRARVAEYLTTIANLDRLTDSQQADIKKLEARVEDLERGLLNIHAAASGHEDAAIVEIYWMADNALSDSPKPRAALTKQEGE